MTSAVRISRLGYQYNYITALNDLSLDIPAGEIFGLIGPDGAGKTTLMRIICTLVRIPSAKVSIFGMDVSERVGEIRKIIGYMPQRFSLYQDLSVEQNLRFFAKLFGVGRLEYEARVSTLYEFSRLAPYKDRRAGALSGGMKQKLALSCALIHSPRLLVLDEPTYGVDPLSRLEFWDILRELKENGSTLVVSTPNMEEAGLCDTVALLHKGGLLRKGSPADIISNHGARIYSLRSDDLGALRDYLRGIPDLGTLQLFGTELHFSLAKSKTESDLVSLSRISPVVFTFSPVSAGMEDIFLELMSDDPNA